MVSRLWSDFYALSFNQSQVQPELIPPPYLECLFQLFVMFWTEDAYTKPLEQNALIHFSGVLGIHPHDLAYRSAYLYTTYLSTLIWIGRLVSS